MNYKGGYYRQITEDHWQARYGLQVEEFGSALQCRKWIDEKELYDELMAKRRAAEPIKPSVLGNPFITKSDRRKIDDRLGEWLDIKRAIQEGSPLVAGIDKVEPLNWWLLI